MQDDARFAEQRIGSVLCEKWTLERLLGVGGMAAVYAARHRIGSEVAIKILHPQVARSKELRMRFEREARVANTLKHPGAVEVRDVDVTEDGTPFMVMELLHGEALSDRLRRLDAVPVQDTLRFTDEMLDVLAAAHAQGIIHRDIKLDNVFITSDGRVKVLDFGIARMREGVAMTMVGARLGTLPYMPPEQVRGIEIDARADVFAVGAVMFRLVAKRRIHEARSEGELISRMAATPAPPLATVVPQAPPPLCLVVDRALAFERERRYPDAATMQEDVKALRRGEAPPYAARKLTELGPPNPSSQDAPGLGPVPTRAAIPAAMPSISEATAATRAPGIAPCPPSATAAATPFEPAPASGGAVVGAGPAFGSVAFEPTAASGGVRPSLGSEPTALPARSLSTEPTALAAGAAALPAQGAERTMLSTGTPALREATQVSPGAAAASSPRKPPWLLAAIAGGVVALLVVVVTAWALSGSDETSGPDEEPSAVEESAEDDPARTEREPARVDTPVAPAADAPAAAETPAPRSPAASTAKPVPAPRPAPSPAPAAQPTAKPPPPPPPLDPPPARGRGKGNKHKKKDKDD